MKRNRNQHGFTLIAEVFLLVVVAALVVYVSNIRSVQQTTLVYGVQGARAMQAARSGIQWGIREAIVDGFCTPTTTFTLPGIELDDFSIEVQCAATNHNEGGTLVTTYMLTSIASSGAFGSLDYIQRRIQASVSLDPP